MGHIFHFLRFQHLYNRRLVLKLCYTYRWLYLGSLQWYMRNLMFFCLFLFFFKLNIMKHCSHGSKLHILKMRVGIMGKLFQYGAAQTRVGRGGRVDLSTSVCAGVRFQYQLLSSWLWLKTRLILLLALDSLLHILYLYVSVCPVGLSDDCSM